MSAHVFRPATVGFLYRYLAVTGLTYFVAALASAQDPPRPTAAATAAPGLVVRGVPDTSIKMLAFSPDGKTLAGGSGDQTIKTWNAASGRPGPTLAGHSAAVAAIFFTADGKALLSAAKEINRWDTTTWQLAESVKLEKWQYPNAVRFSPDGRRLAMIAGEDQLSIYDVASGIQLYDTKLDGMPLSLAFTPDGKSLAVGKILKDPKNSRGLIQFFNVSTGQAERSFDAPGASVSALAFSADGSLLGYAGFQKVIVVNAKDGKFVKEFPGQVGVISAIAFSPDGTILASGGEGPGFRLPQQWMLMSETRLWDMKTGRQTWANVGELARVSSLVFASDGKQMARCDEKSVLMQPVPDNSGRAWLVYTTDSDGIGRDMSEARMFRQMAAAQGIKAVAGVAPDALRKNSAKSQVELLANAVETYKVTVNSYPSGLADLVQQPADAAIAKRWVGPYLREKPKPDPWGNEFRYAAPGKRNPQSFDVWSAGPDGQDGTADDIGNSREPLTGDADRR